VDATPPSLTDQLHSSSGSYELVLSAALFGVIGLFIDRRLGTTPWFMVVTTVLGFVGATVSIYYRYRHDIHRLTEQRAASQVTEVGS
jgi:F0F1-type ATP synthase assembly protein I